MKGRFTILIADRNVRIRQFLRREIASEGYRVFVAENAGELSSMIRKNEGLDLLILDDATLRLNESRVHGELENRIPRLPFILHSFSTESLDPWLVEDAAAFVEKTGKTEALLETIREVLREEYPSRFDLQEQASSGGGTGSFRDPAPTMETRKG